MVLLVAGCASGGGEAGGGPGSDSAADVAASPDSVGDAPVPGTAGDTAVPQDTSGTGDDGGETGVDTHTADGADTHATDATGSPDGGGALGAGAFCVAYGEAWCELLDRCPPPWRAAWPGGCASAMTVGCQAAWLDAAAADGTLAFDGAAAASCIEALDSMTCAASDALWLSQADNVPADCKAALAGSVPPGGDCSVGPECAEGAVCVFGDSCPGVCTAQGAPGDPCAKGELCAWPESLCVEGTCTALPGEGAPCLTGLCRAPLVCEGGLCMAPGLAGASCEDGAPCYAGLICFRPSDQQPGTCTLPRALGETCFASWQCDPTSSVGRLVCAGGSCQVAPGPGQPCWEFLCDGAACDAAQIPPTCVPLPGPGAPCWQGGACATGAFCDGGSCAALGTPGDPCGGHSQCASFRCYGGVCVAPDAPACSP